MLKICANFVPRVHSEDQKERRSYDSREMVELINSDPAVLDALVTCDESCIYYYDPETKRQTMMVNIWLMSFLKRNQTKWHHIYIWKIKPLFSLFVLHSVKWSKCSNLFLSKLQICQIILTYPVYHHLHVVPLARISLILSRHFSLSFIASGMPSGPHPVSSHSCWMYVRAGRPAFALPYVGVHRSTSLMSSDLHVWFV